VPVIEKTIGTGKIWHGVVSRAAPQTITMAKDAVPVVNAGQAGYFRTLYAPALFTRLAYHFTRLSPEDQLGLLNDSAALGYAGDAPLSDFLALARQASPQMQPLVLLTLANRLAGLDRLYRGLPGQDAFRRFAQAILDPLYASTGWTAKAGEDQNVALLRTALLSALSQMNDPAVIAEARKQFAQFEKDPASLSGDQRRNVLAIVATHADSKAWNALRTMARTTHNSLEKRELYTLLGRAQDPALAQSALAIALTNEAPTTFRPAIIASVSRHFPDSAFDFVQTHLDAVNTALEPDSRNSFAPDLIAGSVAADAPVRLEAFAEKHIPASARGDVTKAEATLAFTRRIRAQRLPEASQWLAQRHN
jgi:aminopeptidase N